MGSRARAACREVSGHVRAADRGAGARFGRLAGASVTAGKLAPADERLLQVLTRAPESWMSAAQVAKACGKTWYTVSFSLRRLTERGLVEEDVISRRGTARSVEHTRVYRVRPLAGESRRVSTLPAWLAPQAVVAIGFSTMVEGVAAIRDERRDRRDPERPAAEAAPEPALHRRAQARGVRAACGTAPLGAAGARGEKKCPPRHCCQGGLMLR
jgi:DNA-binding transcriptional ArsR family regulator